VDTPRTLAIVSDPHELDPLELPAGCVIKANNGWARNLLVKDSRIQIVGNTSDHPLHGKPVVEAWDGCLKILNEWFTNPFNPRKEPQYKHIEPKIFVEELLDPVPTDLKFFVFDGTVRMIQIDQDRYGEYCRDLFDPDWNHLPVRYTLPNSPSPMARPENLEELIQVSEVLSDDLDFVRVDLFNISNRILGSELTLTPSAGNLAGLPVFDPPGFRYELSRFWNFPEGEYE